MDQKTWGWIKVLGGLVALWFSGRAWMATADNVSLAVVMLSLLTIAGGYWKSTGKGR
jgi:hypothetical protein